MLIAGFAKGLLFDPGSKRFLEPGQEPIPEVPPEPTVFSESLAWWLTHWTTIEPKSRKETLRYICRPVTDFVRKGSKAPAGLDAYLRWQMLPPKDHDVPVPPELADAASWMREFSLPVREVDAAMWQTYVDRWKINTRSGRPLAQSSLTRHLADVRQLWAWVCATNEMTDPWPLLKTHIRSSAGGRKGSMVRPVDRTIVLAPSHVRELAEVCGEGSFGPLAEVYVLLLGIAGGRPGESAGVEAEDLELTSDECNVKFRRTSRRGIDQSYLDPDDDAIWGPLKGREIADRRTVPIPLRDAARIRSVLAAERVKGPLFHGWDRDKFCRDVWDNAKAELAERYAHRGETGDVDPRGADALRAALRRLRLHDLRHAACSMWLNTPDIEVKIRPGMAASRSRASQRSRLRGEGFGRVHQSHTFTASTTKAGCQSATSRIPPRSRMKLIRRWWNQMGRARFPEAGPTVDHRRRRGLQRIPGPGVETPSGQAVG